MVSTMRKPLVVAALAALAAGCGGASKTTQSQVASTIVAFSEASGTHACDYLTTLALNELFLGGPHRGDHAQALAACRRASASLTGAPAVVTRIWYPKAHEAKAFAHQPGTRKGYTVTLRQQPGGPWMINRVQH